MIYFDFGLKWIHDSYKRKLVAYYYNKGLEWDKEVEILYKGHNLPPGVGLVDHERQSEKKITPFKWITDTSIGKRSWGYIRNEKYKTEKAIIHNFIDRISKNGSLLLNFGPKADGSIPTEAIIRMKSIGKWLNVNQEGIYGTTPWVIAEEGPKRFKLKGFASEIFELNYNHKNLRFMTKDKNLYVFALGWPKSEILIKTLTKSPKGTPHSSKQYIIEDCDIQSIHLLGNSVPLSWQLTNDGLKIQLPQDKPCDHAWTFKIIWKD